MWTRDNKWYLTDEAFEDRFQGNTMEAVCIGNWRHLSLEEMKGIINDEGKNKIKRKEKYLKRQISILLSWDNLTRSIVDDIKRFYGKKQGSLLAFPLPESFRKSSRGDVLKNIPAGTPVRFVSDLNIYEKFGGIFSVEFSIQTIDYIDIKENENV